MSEHSRPADSPLTWTDDGQPRSAQYDDVYFSAEDGLAETHAVFLQGCGLPDAWAGRSRFVVGELGFGTGLNVAALLELWRRTRPTGGHLHVFSVEAHPITAAEAARALARWPELSEVAAPLLAGWPGRARGFHRLDLPQFHVTLDLAVMEATAALEAWSGAADAWFLDGFSPARNPAMWSDEVLALVARRSAPGARAATFTVAGHVRRALAAAGFEVERRAGFGRKRQRLEAILPGRRAGERARTVAVVGAGIAGAAAARAIRALGATAVLIEADAPGAGASGNPAALVTPRLDAGLGPPAALFAQAFARAVQLYEAAPGAVLARGVLQLAADDRHPARFATIAAADLFEPDALELLSPARSTDRLGEPAPAALDQRTAITVAPDRVLEAWAGDICQARVASLIREEAGWRLLDAAGAEIAVADAVILAGALEAATLAPDAPLSPVRGQVTWAPQLSDAASAAAWGGYVLGSPQGLMFGSTHDRGDTGTEVREADHSRNLETLRAALPQLARRLAGARLEGRAAIRAVTPDRVPLAGEIADGLFLLAGFGSRGFSLAPLLAEHVAALALGAPSPLPTALAEIVDPRRFARRAARRGSS
ncbi:tRNA (5-methylaminomethyl-2-thiouridine)(34)-methyltransferase MnmD [Phenylobacterium sp.]|uniref:tRNA (5-methylaminomethyl-2-thiouridine)(34)-methyltransferase MnmD n=1 Tax=Phenylobacterium sp. TaxID=1871053 RepID=UPI0039834377